MNRYKYIVLAVAIVGLRPGFGGAQSLNINVYSQNDASWSWDKMGTSCLTEGRYGRMMTCLASAYSVTPKTLNTWLSANGGYTSSGALNPSVAANYDGSGGLMYASRGTLPNNAASIANGLGRGAVYIVRSTRFAEYWVLVYDSTRGQSYYLDPWDGTTRRVGGSEAWVRYGAEARIYLF